MSDTFIQIADKFNEFADNTYHGVDQFKALIKLNKEVKELIDYTHANRTAKGGYKSDVVEEAAECIMCIIHSCHKQNISPKEIVDAFEMKLEKNRHRQWIKNSDGTYSHKPM